MEDFIAAWTAFNEAATALVERAGAQPGVNDPEIYHTTAHVQSLAEHISRLVPETVDAPPTRL